MFEKIYERLKSEARSALRLWALAAACLGAAAIALGFLCAAGFVFALNQLGPVYACLIGFGVFLFGTLILVLGYAALSVRRRRLERERAAADAGASLLANPQLVLFGLRMVESIGVRRLLPIVALSAAAFALGSGVMRARAEAGEDNPPAG